MTSKIKTIWKFGIIFAEKESELGDMDVNTDSIIYKGALVNIPDKVVEHVAEIHPSFQAYNQAAMATLYKTYSFKGGTENPKFAIHSLKTPDEIRVDMPYVLIWDIVK